MKPQIIIGISLLALLLASCSSEQKEAAKTEPAVKMPASLQNVLDAKRDAFNASAPEEMKKVFAEGLQEVATSGVMESALRVGDTAPDFILPNAHNDSVQLSTILESGPVILTWYRGGWCPYCNIQLNAYNDALDDFEKAGGQLVAISPEIPDSSLSTSERSQLRFEVVSDLGNLVAKSYGVAYTLPEGVKKAFEGRVDVAAYNNDNSYSLPLAVTYVIDTDRVIRYAFVDADYRKRAEPAELIRQLEIIQ